jgi:hypothetical protein
MAGIPQAFVWMDGYLDTAPRTDFLRQEAIAQLVEDSLHTGERWLTANRWSSAHQRLEEPSRGSGELLRHDIQSPFLCGAATPGLGPRLAGKLSLHYMPLLG